MDTKEELLTKLAALGTSRWLTLGDAEHPKQTLLDAYKRWKRSKHGLQFFVWAAWAMDMEKDLGGATRGYCMDFYMGSDEPRLFTLWRKERDGVCVWQGNCGPEIRMKGYGFKHDPKQGTISFIHPNKNLVLQFMQDCRDTPMRCVEIERKYTHNRYKQRAWKENVNQ